MANEVDVNEEKRLKKRERELRKQVNVLNRQLRQHAKDTKLTMSNRQSKLEFMDFIVEKYGLIYIPPQLSKKLLAISEGTYAGLTRPIPFEELLLIFDFCKKKINDARVYKRKQGEELLPLAQFNYDLAIVLSNAEAFYKKRDDAKAKIEDQLERAQYNIEKAVAGQDIARKKLRLAELEKIKNERDEVDLEELFSEW